MNAASRVATAVPVGGLLGTDVIENCEVAVGKGHTERDDPLIGSGVNGGRLREGGAVSR